jgi:hypothetical protein
MNYFQLSNLVTCSLIMYYYFHNYARFDFIRDLCNNFEVYRILFTDLNNLRQIEKLKKQCFIIILYLHNKTCRNALNII